MFKLLAGILIAEGALQLTDMRWLISIIFLILSISFQILFARLINLFIRKNAPDISEFQRNRLRSFKDVRGIVPRWVEIFSFISISLVYAGVIPWVFLLIEKIF